ncbi:MAG: hypothetical protein ACXAC2_21340 [Candidatus Kariarchaeaceae archaeon]
MIRNKVGIGIESSEIILSPVCPKKPQKKLKSRSFLIKYIFFSIIVIPLLSFSLISVIPNEIEQNNKMFVINQNNIDEIGQSSSRAVIQTKDDGFIVIGSHENDVLLAKFNTDGKSEWKKTYGGAGRDWTSSNVVQTPDRGFAFTMMDETDILFIIKTDEKGNLKWQKVISENNTCNSLIITSDGGFLAVGSFEPSSGISGIRVDSSGNVVWKYSSIFGAWGFHQVETLDGGFLIAGALGEMLLLKLDPRGNVEWHRIYKNIILEGETLIETKDGGLVFAVRSFTHDGEREYIKLINTDSIGNIKWERIYNGSLPNSLIQTSDGGFAFIGKTNHNYPQDMIFIKTNIIGDTEWTQRYGGLADDHATDVVEKSDGGFIISGNICKYCGTPYGFPSTKGMILVKTDAVGNINWTISFDNEKYEIKGIASNKSEISKMDLKTKEIDSNLVYWIKLDDESIIKSLVVFGPSISLLSIVFVKRKKKD